MGKFVIVDGIDGSGKGAVMDAFREWTEEKELSSIDVSEYCRKHETFPDISEYDVVFSKEPTQNYVGRAISEEFIKDRSYSVTSTAWAFALDREILYKKVIIPALKADKFIFQERGITTSLVYQPVQGRITLKELIGIPGNRLAIKNQPDLVIVTKVEPKVVIQRMRVSGKLGSDRFSELNFQRKIDQRYSSPWLRKVFSDKIRYIDTNPPNTVSDTKKKAIEYAF